VGLLLHRILHLALLIVMLLDCTISLEFPAKPTPCPSLGGGEGATVIVDWCSPHSIAFILLLALCPIFLNFNAISGDKFTVLKVDPV